MMRIKFLAIAAIGLLVLTGCASKSTSSITNLDPMAFQSKTQEAGVVTVDVRTPEEFNAGHIKGAININVESSTFVSAIAKLDRSTPYAVYCHSGRRSAIATAKMSEAKFTSLFNLDGGIQLWMSQGLPLVSTT